ncbi:hypothetical protein DH86_00001827 [Scytalidium sp. 3C]|nr:hypothetical protein DH86_00001827 [Scytalidium sp. 3C]
MELISTVLQDLNPRRASLPTPLARTDRTLLPTLHTLQSSTLGDDSVLRFSTLHHP